MVAVACLTLTHDEAANLIGLRLLLQRIYSALDDLREKSQTNEHDDLLAEIAGAEASLEGLTVHLS